MIIITGTGRSGTCTLARMFGGFHEYRVQYILEKYFACADPHKDFFDTLDKRISVILDLHQGIMPETFVDASNLYIYFLDALYALYPSCRFILSVRHGKDFVRSAVSRGWHERGAAGTVPPRDDPFIEAWENMTPLQRSAWIWTFRNKKALEGLREVPETQKLIVRIEDACKPDTIDKIEVFAGIPLRDRNAARKRYNANPAFFFPPKEVWTAEMNRQFDKIAGEMMRQFCYE